MAEMEEKHAETFVVPKSAASVILLRKSSRGPEVYLLRRHRKAGFMASSYVFPGGISDEGEQDGRLTAARELFEESGVLLSHKVADAPARQVWRDQLNAVSEATDDRLVDRIGFDVNRLHYFSHWITPTVEKRRYSAQFYIARMPEGQTASPDNRETVDEIWVTPEQALAQAKELRLPPPQVRTCWELLEMGSIDAIFSHAKKQSEHAHAILPRMLPGVSELTLLLPWDAQYAEGQGEAMAMPNGHPLAHGPSRFVLRDGVWNHVFAPTSAKG